MRSLVLTKEVHDIAKKHGMISAENKTCIGYPFILHEYDVPEWARYLRSKGITVKDEVFLK